MTREKAWRIAHKMKEFTEKEHPSAAAINLFLKLTQIPRPSGHEAEVAGKIAEFARKHGMEATIVTPPAFIFLISRRHSSFGKRA